MSAWREPIGRALDIVGHDVPCRWWFRDPIASGLHRFHDAGYGRSYRDTSHVCYPWHIDGHADRRLATVVAIGEPGGTRLDVTDMVHELGHIVDWMTGFSRDCTPVSWYAETNRAEAFAEAFTAHRVDGYHSIDTDDAAWFDGLRFG